MPAPFSRRLLLAAAPIVATLLLTACSCPQTTVLVDDFEHCSGTCGWTLSGGGTAKVVSTILPGEHGLQVDGGVTITKSIPAVTIDTTFSLQLVADCPNGLAATLSATVANQAGMSLAVTLAPDTSLDSNGNPPDYSGASYTPLVGAINLPSGASSAIVHQVTLQPNAGATCTVDLVELTSVTPCGS